MLSVYAHEGQINYKFDDQEVRFHGGTVYVVANTTVVYGRQDGELQWEFDEIFLIDVTDEDGETVKLTTEEEKELVTALAEQRADDADIDEQVYHSHQEDLYWSKR